ncbi:MAG: hypothetical protein L3J83_04020 [Proteobacteria bacterium]|nr:hypothetical protein [Pseudomonadota bacterium]
MNEIEQHLKRDAQAFKINPPDFIHSKIMSSIDNDIVNVISNKSRMSNWLFPMGAILVALLLVVFILPQSKVVTTVNDYARLNAALFQVVNINELPISLESHYIDKLKQEQENILKDVAYMRSLFVL